MQHTYVRPYTLHLAADGQPRVASYASLAGALCEAWRVALNEDQILQIKLGGELILDGGDLRELFAGFEGPDAEGDCQEWASRLVRAIEDVGD